MVERLIQKGLPQVPEIRARFEDDIAAWEAVATRCPFG